MKVIGIIPARLKSSRLPNKALIDIDGLPMVVHVLKRSKFSKVLDDVLVATDSKQIYEVVEENGGKAVMTSELHKTGTDRIAEVAKNISADIVVNIQGDEPLLEPSHIDKVVEPLLKEKEVKVAMLVTPYTEKNNPSDIKAVLDLENNIMYSSRSDLPSNARGQVSSMWKICHIVPFRKDFLLQFSSWEQTPLEKIEFQEYLRILEHGVKIRAVPVKYAHISVDVEDDLVRVREIMKTDILRKKYS